MKKKVFGMILALSFFSLSTALNKNHENHIAIVEGEDCLALFDGVYDAYYKVYRDSSYSWQAATWAYEGCVANGGNPGGDSVVIIG